MLEELPFTQLLEWQAFDSVEPFGDKRGDWQAASICAVIQNIEARRRGASHVFTPAEFLLEFKEKESVAKEIEVPAAPVKSWQEMKMIGMMMAAASQAPAAPSRRRRR